MTDEHDALIRIVEDQQGREIEVTTPDGRSVYVELRNAYERTRLERVLDGGDTDE